MAMAQVLKRGMLFRRIIEHIQYAFRPKSGSRKIIHTFGTTICKFVKLCTISNKLHFTGPVLPHVTGHKLMYQLLEQAQSNL